METSNLLKKRAYPILEFCRTYGIGRSKAYVEMAEGRLRSVTVGRRRLIRADDAENWLASLTSSSNGEAI
jgi:excisionase family DNA binding protein